MADAVLAAALRADVARLRAGLGVAMRIAVRCSLLSFFAALKNRLVKLRAIGRPRPVNLLEPPGQAGAARQPLQTGHQRDRDGQNAKSICCADADAPTRVRAQEKEQGVRLCGRLEQPHEMYHRVTA
ncbi:hypothetical protein D3C72_1671040 [compost metagenome]